MRKALIIVLIATVFLATLASLMLPQKVEAAGGEMIVGVNYSNTVSAFLNRDAALMREAGIKSVRLMFNPYAMSNSLPSLVPAIVNAKFEVLGVLYNRELLDANNINGWMDYVYSTVSTYKNYVKVWEVWNEPDWNTGFAPNGQVGDVVKYTQWLKAAYPRAKQADPTCRILGGSISVMQDNTLSWLSKMYDNGAKAYMDVLSVHPYSNTSPLPPAITSGGKAFWRAQDARNTMIQRGDTNKRMWFTELGWRTYGSGVVVTEALQAQYIKDALTYAKTNWGWLETFIIYQWQDGGGSNFGILRSDGSRKPSFYAVKTFTQNVYTLTVNYSGSGSGLVAKNPDQATYLYGSVVTLTATATAGSSFAGWSGDLTGSSNPIQITMNGYKTVTATFISLPAGVLFSDGFESGSTSAWTGVSGAPVVQSSIKHHGTYAMRAAASMRSCYFNIAQLTLAVYMRAYFYVDAADASVELMRFTAGTNIVALVKRTSAGALQLGYRSGGSVLYLTNAAVTLPLDSWHCIELRTVVGASGAYSVWLDGVEISAFHITGVDNDNYGVITYTYVGCIYFSGTAVNVYVDDAVVSKSYVGP